MKPVQLIHVPYDSGRHGERFGRGPLKARDADLASRLGGSLEVSEQTITHGSFFPTEGTVAFDLARRISQGVAEASGEGRFPIVIAGNCISSLGTVSGMGGTSRSVVWLDAHPDFNTPDTTLSGFMDGMATSILAGETWATAARSVPGFRPVDRRRFLFIGARDIDPEEAIRLRDPPVAIFSGDDYRAKRATIHAALDALGAASDATYLHVDMDVTEPIPVPANEYAVPGGFNDEEIASLLKAVANRMPLMAAGVTAYDPGLDVDGSMMSRYLRVIEQLAVLGARQ